MRITLWSVSLILLEAYGMVVFVNQCARVTDSASVEGLGGFPVPYSASSVLLGTLGDGHVGPGEVASVGFLIGMISFFLLRLTGRSDNLTRFGKLLTTIMDTVGYGALIALAWTTFIWVFMPFWMSFQVANFLGEGSPLTNLNLMVISVLVLILRVLFHYAMKIELPA
jgi:hypothetical protein